MNLANLAFAPKMPPPQMQVQALHAARQAPTPPAPLQLLQPQRGGLQDEVLSATGGEFALPDDLQLLACYLADGRLLISRSHRGEPRIMAYAARLERVSRTVQPMYVELAAIQSAYAAARERGQASGNMPAYNGSSMQAFAVNLFRRAASRSASDIHIRVTEAHSTQVLFRVLGDLELVEEQSPAFGAALCSTIYQAMTDQSDATFVPSHPQDGRVSDAKVLPVNVSGVRVATSPQVGGSLMVLRLLYKSSAHGIDLATLGFSAAHQEAFARLRRRPTGININSGPTGAGKSTTLQCALSAVIRQTAGRSHVITVEDPPEYPIPGAVQTPVVSGGTEEGRSAAFQSAIRAAMRLDPDIIMIGEMRDGPSARLAVAAAMTGHQVWTTLHANYAIDVMDRLVDLGVPIERLTNPSVVSGLVSQRLVKSLCPRCRLPFARAHAGLGREPEDLRRMADQLGSGADTVFVCGTGCEHCRGSGYLSRTVLAEVMETDVAFMARMRAGDRQGALDLWRARGGRSIAEHAQDKVFAGQVDPFDTEEQVSWT